MYEKQLRFFKLSDYRDTENKEPPDEGALPGKTLASISMFGSLLPVKPALSLGFQRDDS